MCALLYSESRGSREESRAASVLHSRHRSLSDILHPPLHAHLFSALRIPISIRLMIFTWHFTETRVGDASSAKGQRYSFLKCTLKRMYSGSSRYSNVRAIIL